MTNLTEQWKKGELPEGWYYIKLKTDSIDIDRCIINDGKMLRYSYLEENEAKISEVLAPVPSYDEWQAKDDALTALLAEYGKLTKELQDEKEKHMTRFSLLSPADEVVMLEAENAKLKEEVSRESYKVSEAYCYVEELKELLKRCYSFIDWCELGVPVAQRPILMKDINKALGEDK